MYLSWLKTSKLVNVEDLIIYHGHHEDDNIEVQGPTIEIAHNSKAIGPDKDILEDLQKMASSTKSRKVAGVSSIRFFVDFGGLRVYLYEKYHASHSYTAKSQVLPSRGELMQPGFTPAREKPKPTNRPPITQRAQPGLHPLAQQPSKVGPLHPYPVGSTAQASTSLNPRDPSECN